MQDSENLHYVTIKTIKDHIRLDESAAEVGSDLRAATADLRESGECLALLVEGSPIMLGN